MKDSYEEHHQGHSIDQDVWQEKRPNSSGSNEARRGDEIVKKQSISSHELE